MATVHLINSTLLITWPQCTWLTLLYGLEHHPAKMSPQKTWMISESIIFPNNLFNYEFVNAC
jgi:hypothetical protein